MKVDIGWKLQIQWQASTRPNSKKAIAKLRRQLRSIGVDYDQKVPPQYSI